ncbi:Bestrophin/UPF0187, partial [Blastocladiella britannica]
FVLSLLLAMKNSTSYDKYSEGRKLWAALLTQSRNLARMIWIGISEKSTEDHYQKEQAVRLILAFFVSCRNSVRDETGFVNARGSLREDLLTLLPDQKQKQIRTMAGQAAANGNAGPSHPNSLSNTGRQQTGYLTLTEENIPVDISHMLAAFIMSQNKAGNLDASQFGTLNVLTNGLVESYTSMERVAHSKLPAAYRVHLKQLILFWLMLLPLQIVQTHGLIITPVLTALVTFTFLGIDAIGNEIEQPFGYDANDLPLDQFCADLAAELNELLSSDVTELAFWGHSSSTAIDMVAAVTVPAAAVSRDISMAPLPPAAPPKSDHTVVPIVI